MIVGVVTKWRCQAKTVIQRVYRYDAEEAEHLDFHVNIIFVIKKVETAVASNNSEKDRKSVLNKYGCTVCHRHGTGCAADAVRNVILWTAVVQRACHCHAQDDRLLFCFSF